MLSLKEIQNDYNGVGDALDMLGLDLPPSKPALKKPKPSMARLAAFLIKYKAFDMDESELTRMLETEANAEDKTKSSAGASA